MVVKLFYVEYGYMRIGRTHAAMQSEYLKWLLQHESFSHTEGNWCCYIMHSPTYASNQPNRPCNINVYYVGINLLFYPLCVSIQNALHTGILCKGRLLVLVGS